MGSSPILSVPSPPSFLSLGDSGSFTGVSLCFSPIFLNLDEDSFIFFALGFSLLAFDSSFFLPLFGFPLSPSLTINEMKLFLSSLKLPLWPLFYLLVLSSSDTLFSSSNLPCSPLNSLSSNFYCFDPLSFSVVAYFAPLFSFFFYPIFFYLSNLILSFSVLLSPLSLLFFLNCSALSGLFDLSPLSSDEDEAALVFTPFLSFSLPSLLTLSPFSLSSSLSFLLLNLLSGLFSFSNSP